VAFSPDSKEIVTTSADGTVRLWDVASSREVSTLGNIGDTVIWSAVFSPNGKYVLAAAGDGSIRRYLVTVSDLLRIAACRVDRGLTQEEIARFHVPVPVQFDFARRQCPPNGGGG